jgi:hypothetical protein
MCVLQRLFAKAMINGYIHERYIYKKKQEKGRGEKGAWARCIAEHPASFSNPGSAPFLSRKSTADAWPALTAAIKEVVPAGSKRTLWI